MPKMQTEIVSISFHIKRKIIITKSKVYLQREYTNDESPLSYVQMFCHIMYIQKDFLKYTETVNVYIQL